MRCLVLGMWLVVLACAGGVSYVQVAESAHEMKAKKHVDEVEVFVTARPTRAFQEVGLVEDNYDLGIEALRRKAAQEGCDAVILLDAGQSVSGRGWVTPYVGLGTVGSRASMRAVCLVYTDEKKP